MERIKFFDQFFTKENLNLIPYALFICIFLNLSLNLNLSLKALNESHFKTLRELSSNGNLTQRELSEKLGLSLGSVNYVIQALIGKGYVKAQRFKNSKNKIGYIYILTPKGMSEKVKQTQEFIYRKMAEYEKLKREIETLKNEQ